tara:strand:+ start:130 stop:300 length:171 start_codon:yes stop_codon:yes gene_type:complete
MFDDVFSSLEIFSHEERCHNQKKTARSQGDVPPGRTIAQAHDAGIDEAETERYAAQ